MPGREPRESCRDTPSGTSHFDDAVAEMEQPFVVLDSDECLVAYNRAYADLHRNADGSSALRPGLTFEALTEWRLRTGFFAGVVEAAGTVADFFKQKGEVTYQLYDGRWMLVERSRLPDGRNIGLWIDITPVKRVEAQLRETGENLRRSEEQAESAARALETANEQLERRVVERTQQLTLAQEELLKKERLSTIGQLTATVAHELRNPLSAIKNTVYALKEVTAGTGPAAARLVGRIERSLDRCNQIIAELLDYSRMRALQCEARCLDEWLSDVLDEQDVPANLAVTRDLNAGASRVDLDPDRFRRVIINLYDNAAQALREAAASCPAPHITIRTQCDDGQIEIVVEDNGPGIPPETLARIFEPLFSTKSFGTGLGLPMVKQIVEQHGGDIAITSGAGEGTRARVRVPLCVKSAAA